MANSRMLTLVKNLVEDRRLVYIPPVGRVVQRNETVLIPGAIETMIHLGMDSDVQDEYIYDLLNARIQVTTEGFGGTGGGTFNTIVGDGVNTVFTIDAGFLTSAAQVLIYDLISGSIVHLAGVYLALPDPTSIMVVMSPAPALDQIQVFIFA